MRTSSVLKTMAFWFVVPVVLVGAAGYAWLNQPSSSNSAVLVSEDDLDGLEVKKQFAPPAVEVNSKVGSQIRSRGRLIGKRPRKPKKTVTPLVETSPDAVVGPPPIADPPPTSSPVDGG
ncbi:MAG: hypothetical protein ABL962_12175 [Fimbriimonadaceae bacterium]